MAADPEYQSEYLGDLPAWQTNRIFFNTSWWFYGSRDKFAAADKTNMLSVDVGVYYPNLGLSNNEIASLSRSMHKSQGFGSTGSRGSRSEYLELIKGEMPVDKENLFEGINTSWSRIEGAEHITGMIEEVLENFDFSNPAVHINELMAIKDEIGDIKDEHWKAHKLKEIDDIIVQSLGLYIEAKTSSPYASLGENITIDIEAVNRSSADVKLLLISTEGAVDTTMTTLADNDKKTVELSYVINENDLEESNPYWLNKPGSLGTYDIQDLQLIGKPINESPINVTIDLSINGFPMRIERPIVYKRNDPVDGEVYEPFVVLPKASISFDDPVYIIPSREEKSVKVTVKTFADSLNGRLYLNHPKSFNVSPDFIDLTMNQSGSVQNFEFKVRAPYMQESANFSAVIKTPNEIIDEHIKVVDYDHIPKQYIRSKARASVQRLNINTVDRSIAYIDGAGDDVAESLAQIGYQIDLLEVDDVTADKLAKYDVIVMGVRAYNIHPELRVRKEMLMNYIANGGTLIVQYNTNRGGLKGEDISPYSMTLSRDRVTDENAPVSFVNPDHQILNYPNKITSLDFKNWVQERGLYFPNEWNSNFQTPLATSDRNAEPTQGGLLIAEHGEGYFVYTGLSWFRQLPAGVPGAYRLFANLIGIGSTANIESNDNYRNGR